MARILMPKATAVWLIDNTTLTFEQIADFCELHPLEVKGIADGEVAENMRGADPVASGELTREEIEKGEKDKAYRLRQPAPKHAEVPQPKKKGARFTPVSRRKDRPDAIAWFLRHHPEVTDAQISRLIGTTKSTIESVRSRQHWNAPNLKPVDPVTLGLCSQIDLDFEVQRAAKDRPQVEAQEHGGTLMPAEISTAPERVDPFADMSRPKPAQEENIDVNSVFAKLKQLKRDDEDEE